MALINTTAKMTDAIHPFLEESGNDGGGQQDVKQRCVKLEEKANPFAPALLCGQTVEAVFLLAPRDLRGGQATAQFHIEQAHDLLRLQLMP